MIVAISRFKVANGMEDSVRQAFLHRPRFVDEETGFLGLEVFSDKQDPSILYLLTRWTDSESFQAWHSSENHHRSHAFIPKGLKLDPTMTKVIQAERVAGQLTLEESTADSSPFLARFFTESETIHYVAATRDGTIRVCSAAVAKALRKPASEIVGRPVYDLLTDTDAETLRKLSEGTDRHPDERLLLNFVDAEFRPYTLQCQVDKRPDGFVLIGERRSLHESALENELIQVNNELAVLSRENIRKSRALERAMTQLEEELQERQRVALELRKSNEDLEQFAYVASHDLLEPLRTISGFAQLLRRRYKGKLDGDADDFIEHCVTGTRRLHALIRDLLAYSRANNPELRYEEIDLNELIRELRMMLWASIEESKAEISCDDLPVVYGNRHQFFQVLENLVANAIKFRDKNGIRIHVSGKTTDSHWGITVRDDGPGIETQYLEKIFEPFQRLHDRNYPGSGIGLALCRKIVERYQGTIWAESVPGHGTAVHLTIGRVAEPAETPLKQAVR